MIRSFPAITAACAVVSQFFCASLNTDDGNGSGVGNGKISGVLHNPDGSRAKNAVVQAIPSDYSPISGLDKSGAVQEIRYTTTDDTGGFTFDSLPERLFNILGSDETNRSFMDSVRTDKKTPVILAPDTLRAPGAINGVVRLLPEHTSKTVVILVIGTKTSTGPEDSIGNFTLAGMAKGRYHVRFLSTQPGYQPLDTHMSVASGSVEVFPDTLRLKFTGVPVPSGLKTDYDTLKQIVTVRWNRVDPALVSAYTVYRRNIDSTAAPTIVHTGPSTDTLYRDSTALQDMSYEYRVTAINGRNEESAKSISATVTITGIFSVAGSIVKGSGTQRGQFGYMARIALDSAGNIYITDTKNNRLQKFDGSGNLIFMDTSFLMPMGLTISSRNEALVSDFDEKTVVTMDLDGTRTGAFSTAGRPLGALSINGTHYIVSDSGVEVLNDSGGLIQLTRLQNDAYYAGDIAADDSDAIAVVFGDKVYGFDKGNNTASLLFQLPERYGNQNGRAVFIWPGIILVMTNHANAPVGTTVLALNHAGEVVAKWGSRENIMDIHLKSDTEVVAVTDNGKILRLIVQKALN